MSSELPIYASADASGSITLRVKVVPGARSGAIAGVLGDRLKVRVSTPPEDGRANAAVIELLAQALSIDRRAIELINGATQPQKTLRLNTVPRQWPT